MKNVILIWLVAVTLFQCSEHDAMSRRVDRLYDRTSEQAERNHSTFMMLDDTNEIVRRHERQLRALESQ